MPAPEPGEMRRLRAEERALEETLRICDRRISLLNERRRSRGESAVERSYLRREIGAAWKDRYKEIAEAYREVVQHLQESDVDIDADDESQPQNRWMQFIAKCQRYAETTRGSQPAAGTSADPDEEADDLAQLAVELQRVIDEEGGPGEADESVETKPMTAEGHQRDDQEQLWSDEHLPGGGYLLFDVVDEFGRPLNEPSPASGNGNAARIVYSDERSVVFAPPSGVPAARSRSPVLLARNDRSSRLLQPLFDVASESRRTPADARSAGELRESGSDMMDMQHRPRGSSTSR